MKNYLIVETRDLLETRDTEWTGALACKLARNKAEATVFLTENGVLAARAAYDATMLRQCLKKGVRVFADSFALEERGIALCDLAKGVEVADIGLVTDRMIKGATVLWR